MKRSRRRLLIALFVAFDLFVLLPCGFIVINGLTDEVAPSDVAIVLGNKVNPDGTPSRRLRARLDRALELYRQGQVKNIIVSGGTGVEGHDEASVMRDYLIAGGVGREAIVADSAGVNTLATAQNSAAIMKAHGWTSAIAVTQYFHIARTRMALKAQGLSPVGGAHARLFELRDLYSIPREEAGYAVYAWKLR